MNPAPAPLPGLDRLIALLREARLTVAVGTSEAIDAARVLAHHAQRAASGSGRDALAALRLRLRPVLCKSAPDLLRFDEVFDAWQDEVMAAMGTAVAPSAAPDPQDAADASTAATTPPPAAAAPSPWRRPALWLGLLAVSAVGAWVWWSSPATVVTPAPVVAPASAPTVSARVPVVAAPALPAQAPAPPASAPAAEPPIRGFTPDWQGFDGLRTPWLVLLLALPLLGLLPLLGKPPPLPYVTRQRGAGSLMLEGWPPNKHRRQLVRELAPATGGQLQRHVRGAVDQREAFARRPQLDLRRTVTSTLERGGLLTLHYRFARLRPAYTVLLQAGNDDDLPVLWARRLAELDVSATLFRFDGAADGAEPTCIEVNGLGRRLPFSALPAPGPAQRLLIVARTGVLVGDDGKLRGWVQAARLERWAQRVLFTPDEPRDWPRRHVERLEAEPPAGPGLLVLPFEDNALDAWSELLVRGELPAITLEAPQLYPRLLRDGEARFVGDTTPAALADDPAQAAALAQQLVTQLQAYLGQNGFYWLCACAVPPLLEPRLALLLGEEYFRRCGASEPRVAAYMARNWRLLLRLPWLRDGGQQLPQWLRLTLLARLPPVIQDELRDVVRGALGRRAATKRSPDGLALTFEDPDAAPAPPGSAPADPRHALLVGFVRDGLDARELMLRLPGEWQQWLPAASARRGRRRPAAVWRGARQRLRRADATAWVVARRTVAGAVLVSATALATLGAVPAQRWPAALHAALFVPQAHSVVLRGANALALDGAGRVLLDLDVARQTVVLRDAVTAQAMGTFPDMPRDVLGAAFAADGPRLFTIHPDASVRVWDTTTRVQTTTLVDEQAPTWVLPNRDRSPLIAVHRNPAGAVIWDMASGRRLSMLQVDPGQRPVAAALGREPGALVLLIDEGGRLVRRELRGGGGAPEDRVLPGDPKDLLDLAPSGQHWLMRTGSQVRLHALRDDLPDEGVPVFDGDVESAVFGADGRHLLVRTRNPAETHILRATEAVSPPADVPADLPPGTVFRGRPWHAATFDLPVWIRNLMLVNGVPLLALLAALGWARRVARCESGPGAQVRPAGLPAAP